VISGQAATKGRRGLGRRSLLRLPTSRALVYLVLIAWAILDFYPVIWTFLSSLKSPLELYENPFGLPASWSLANYALAWSEAKIGQFFTNSMIIAIGATTVGAVLASTVAFVFARFEFRGRGVLWLVLMVGFLVPTSTVMVPLIVFSRALGIYGTHLAIVLVLAVHTIPFSVFFLRAYMESLPRELEEAAIVDGATMRQVFLGVVVPLSVPAIAILSIFNFLTAWNEYTLVVLLSQSDSTFTLPVGIQFLSSTFNSNQPAISAGLVITMLPVVVAFVFFQRYIIRGVTAGALKG
jgi:ABC-type glycerol-3-phosphate transport system permease component